MGWLVRSSLVSLAAFPMTLAAQAAPVEYAVKFVCGSRVVAANATTASLRNAVKPGVYNTAINLYNLSPDTVRIRTRLAGTDSAAVAGRLFPLLSGLVLPPDRALELDCDDILKAAERAMQRGVSFLKGFARLISDKELEVVAVYTAGPPSELATMDVERVLPRKPPAAAPLDTCSLADLTIVSIETPVPLTNLTRTKVHVANVGNALASNIEVQLEDVSDTSAQRTASATIAILAGAGATAVVALDHPYLVPQAKWPLMMATVDPKNKIRECREDNNKKQVGFP